MELEVGMYVRLDRCQGIAKIDEYDEEYDVYTLDKPIGDAWGDETWKLDKDDIIGELSFNIIDLIEEGDYVNGYFVEVKQDKFLIIDSTDSWGWGEGVMPIEEIKSIVTKEQFENMKYRVD